EGDGQPRRELRSDTAGALSATRTTFVTGRPAVRPRDSVPTVMPPGSPAEPAGIVVGEDGQARCWWADSAPQYRAYHDSEWGFPVADDRRLFEKLSLEGFQAGLSWLTILRKREAFRRAFAAFDYARVARFDENDVERLLADAGIVRHRGKIEAVI